MTEPEIVRRPTQAHVNLENLTYNFKSIRSFVGNEVKFMAVVKADAYGHGATECATHLEAIGVDWFGVALLEEAIELRDAGIRRPILCFGGIWPGQESAILGNGITPVVFDLAQARRLGAAAGEIGLTADVHVKLDTGMGRVGVRTDDICEFVREFREIPNLNLEGVMTHFAAADDLGEREFTLGQIRRFRGALEELRDAGFRPSIIDMANSPGAVVFPESRGSMIRIGGLLYGLGGDVLPSGPPAPDLRPVMTLTTAIAQIKRVSKGETLGYGRSFRTRRDSLIGTIPIGYDDGYRRAFSNKGRAIVNGVFVPVAGRVSMDWTLVDLTDIPDVRVGDRVTLIGHDGGLAILAENLASIARTISYEITCGISKRVPRIYS